MVTTTPTDMVRTSYKVKLCVLSPKALILMSLMKSMSAKCLYHPPYHWKDKAGSWVRSMDNWRRENQSGSWHNSSLKSKWFEYQKSGEARGQWMEHCNIFAKQRPGLKSCCKNPARSKECFPPGGYANNTRQGWARMSEIKRSTEITVPKTRARWTGKAGPTLSHFCFPQGGATKYPHHSPWALSCFLKNCYLMSLFLSLIVVKDM